MPNNKPKFLSAEGLLYYYQAMKNLLAQKVDKETGKGLSTNDFSNTEKEKLNNIASGAQVNVIENIKVNNDTQAIDNKTVSISVPTNIVNGSATGSLRSISSSEENTNYTIGNGATAIGNNTKAMGAYSTTEGFATQTDSVAQGAHAEGLYTHSEKSGAHSEGIRTYATGTYSHAEGNETKSWAEASHSEGYLTNARGPYSHAEGVGTTALNKSQHVFGEYNQLDDGTGGSMQERGHYIEIVGNGTSDQVLSNARTLDWSGNQVLAGKLTVGVGPTESMDVTTKQYVDNAISASIGDITSLDFQVVATLPASGSNGVIYLVQHSHDTDDGYDEYIWVNNSWEKLGHADIDLSGYMATTDIITNSDIDAILAN